MGDLQDLNLSFPSVVVFEISKNLRKVLQHLGWNVESVKFHWCAGRIFSWLILDLEPPGKPEIFLWRELVLLWGLVDVDVEM